MDCEDVTFHLAASPDAATKAEDDLEGHLEGCSDCRALVADLAKQPLHWVVGVPPDALADRDLLALAVVDPVVFEVQTELARGGMGRIVRARDRRLGRDVALKEVLSARLDARFAREIAITAQLQHPAIVPIYEAGRWPDGSSFYTMRLVSGGTLAHAIQQTRTLEDRLALLPQMIALTDALAYAHSKKIIHRDLKPGNVLVGEFGETVVIDWGLAKQLDRAIGDAPTEVDRPSSSDLTVVGSVMGTPGFMSPEQNAGATVDERTDVYALGTILYNLLAGKAPYWFGDVTVTPSLIAEREKAGPPEPLSVVAPRVPVDLQVIVERAMARDLKKRYANAKEMADELRRFAAGQLLLSRQYTTRELLVRWLRRHRTVVAVAAVAIVAVAALGIASVHQTISRRKEAELALAASQIEQGRQLLVAGKPAQAAALFAAALPRVDDPVAHRLATIAVRDAERRLGTFPGKAVAFDATTLAIDRGDGSITLVDAETGKIRDTLRSTDAVTQLAFAPSGELLIGTHGGATLAGKQVFRGDVQVARFAGTRLAISDGAAVHVDGASDAAPGVTAFDSAGDHLLALTPTATIVWSLPDLKRLATLPAATYALLDREGGVVLADHDALRRFTLDGASAVLHDGESQPLARLRDGRIASGTEIVDGGALPDSIASEIVAGLDTNHVITGGFDRVIRIARLGLALPLVTLDAADAIDDLVANPAGTRVATIDHGGTIELWDTGHLREPVLATRLAAPIYRVVVGKTGIAAWLRPVAGSNVAILDAKRAVIAIVPGWPVGYRPDSDELVINDGGKLFVYSSTGAEVHVLTDPSAIQTAAFSGKVLATSSANHVTLRDTTTWTITGGFDTHRDDTTAIALDDHGHLVTGHQDGALISWDAHGTARTFGHHSAHVEDIAIRGDRVVTASWDRTTRAWDVATGESRGVVLPSYGHALAIAPSGKLLATIDHATVQIWDAGAGRLLEQFPTASALDSLAFADDDHLVVGCEDGAIDVIDLTERERSTAELVRLAGAMH